MANFADKNAGDVILNDDVNNLSDDTINSSSGHQHSGSEDGHPTLLPTTIGNGASIAIDGRLLFDKGADISSVGAQLIPLGGGNFFDVTGTTTITSIATLQAGTVLWFQFDAVLILTHHATSLILEGGINRTTEAKDIHGFVSLGSGNWQEFCRILQTPSAAHTVASHSDTTGTGAELDTLTDGSNADSLHVHAPLLMAEEGSGTSVSVTWNTAFSGTPVVTGACVGAVGGNSGEVLNLITARSTTGATGAPVDVDGNNQDKTAMFIAMLT